jgi:hypothetical protein
VKYQVTGQILEQQEPLIQPKFSTLEKKKKKKKKEEKEEEDSS